MRRITEIVANNIKAIRSAQDLNQDQLAEKAGLGKSTLAKIETETNAPSIDTLFKIARGLGVSVETLTTDAHYYPFRNPQFEVVENVQICDWMTIKQIGLGGPKLPPRLLRVQVAQKETIGGWSHVRLLDPHFEGDYPTLAFAFGDGQIMQTYHTSWDEALDCREWVRTPYHHIIDVLPEQAWHDLTKSAAEADRAGIDYE